MAGHKFNMVILSIVLYLYFKKKDGLGLCCRNGKKERGNETGKRIITKTFAAFVECSLLTKDTEASSAIRLTVLLSCCMRIKATILTFNKKNKTTCLQLCGLLC